MNNDGKEPLPQVFRTTFSSANILIFYQFILLIMLKIQKVKKKIVFLQKILKKIKNT